MLSSILTRVVFALTVVLACSASPDERRLDARKPPIKLGATLALSGPLSYMGRRELGGMQLAVEEINARGGIDGRPLDLIAEDNLGEAKAAVSGMNKLLNVDRIDVALSAFTHITQAIRGVVRASQRVLIYEAGVRSMAEEDPLTFRDYYDSSAMGRAIAGAVLKERLGSVGYLSETNDSCHEFIEAVKSGVGASGVTASGEETFVHGDTDFRSVLLRLRAGRPGGIVLCTWRDTGIVMRQLKDLGMIGIPTFHMVAINSPDADTPELRRLYEENGTVTSYYGIFEGAQGDRQREFIAAYETRFGVVPAADSAFTYDDIHLLAKALAQCPAPGRVDSGCLARALSESEHDGVAGRLRFNERRVAARPVFLLRVRDGQWVQVF